MAAGSVHKSRPHPSRSNQEVRQLRFGSIMQTILEVFSVGLTKHDGSTV
jgi:hypothetical protein